MILILTPPEEAVLDLIVAQRTQSNRDDDCFLYDLKLGQKMLQSNGNASEYGIGLPEQLEIIQKLSKNGIVEADWIVEKTGDEYKFDHNDENYMWDKYGDLLMLFNDRDYSNYCFVQIGFSQIKKINDNYRAKYECELCYDEIKCRFVVKCNNGEVIHIGKLRQGLQPFEVLRMALGKPNEAVTRDDIVKSGNNAVRIVKKSIATQVFDDNSVVRNELKPFVRLTHDSICVSPKAELTLAQLNKIRRIGL